MGENVLAKMHELMIVFYAFSLILLIFDYLYNNRKAKQSAFWLLCIVWVLQTVFFILYMAELRRFPILAMGEGLYLYAWLLITFSLLLNRVFKIEFAAFFSNVLGFIIVLIYTYAPFRWKSNVLTEQLISELLIFHITFSILAYVVFSFSAICSLLYLLQYKLLKRKKWRKRLWRMNDLAKLENLSFLFNSIGVPILALGVILGLQWAILKIPNLSFFDWKIIGSTFVVMIYSIYLYMKIRKGIVGLNLAYFNLICMLMLFVNFFLFSRFSSFHFWGI